MRFVGIDPSTKTGFVALDIDGNVLKEKELTGVGDLDPKRIVTLTDEIMAYMRPNDVICIEGVPFDTQRAAQAGWIHGSIRNALFRKGFSYYEAAPNAVKKFVSVTGWIGEKGSKKRLTGPAKKKAVKDEVIKHYGFTHKSDNIVDAYVIAQIAMALWMRKQQIVTFDISLMGYQEEVIEHILNPPPPKQKGKKK